MGNRARILAFLVILGAFVAAGLSAFDERGLQRSERLRHEVERRERLNVSLARENQRLILEIQALHSDPGHLEAVARDELGLVGPKEIVIRFDPPLGAGP